MTGIRCRALRIVAAVAEGNWTHAWNLHPRTATDGAYLVGVLAELAGDAVRSAGLEVGAWVEVARDAAVRSQATGGRP
jgi:hypothetical protein